MVAKRYRRKWHTLYRARAWFRITSTASAAEVAKLLCRTLQEHPWLDQGGKVSQVALSDTVTPGSAFGSTPLRSNELEFELVSPAMHHEQFFPFDKYLRAIADEMRKGKNYNDFHLGWCYTLESSVIW